MKYDRLDRLSGQLDPRMIGQHAVKIASNVCFAFFVLTVLTFTILAVTYQPPDPWLRSSKTLAVLLTTAKNVTFHADESVLITPEDLGSQALVELPPAIDGKQIEKEIEAAVSLTLPSGDAKCEAVQTINCSDPGVRAAMEKYNLEKFSSLYFYEYRVPVRAGADDECDVAWKYRASNDGSPRMFRDFRRYKLQLQESCEYIVLEVGPWHSGMNARPLRPIKRRPLPVGVKEVSDGSVTPAVSTNVTAEVGIDVFDLALPTPTEAAFRQAKYLYYSRGGDYCKSMSQYMWSLLCAIGEAKYLNRVFVIDLEICLSSVNNPGNPDEPGKDFRYYFDFDHLNASLPVIDQTQFLKDWSNWNERHPKDKLSVHDIGISMTPMSVLDDQHTILHRVFDQPEPNNYWFKVCEGETEKVLQRPWDVIWKSRRINDVVMAICGRMGWDFDALHVVRGDKIEQKELWPNLDVDTSAEALVRKLEAKVEEGRNVYIATNEKESTYFDKLKGKWKVFQLDDFKDLWDENSDWAKATKELNNGQSVEFDAYMRIEVDSEVLFKAKSRIETFNDLTNDCKSGAGTC